MHVADLVLLEGRSLASHCRVSCAADLLAQAHDIATAEVPLAVRQPTFTLAQARAKAKVPEGPSTRAVGADLWVLGGEGVTWLVGPAKLVKVAGDAIPTV
ncbi:MAG: hypothetical protein ACHQCI_09215, partial [Solirubrobacterales bacterium]